MVRVCLANNMVVGEAERPYIVAELNTSHFGSIQLAKQMITAAKEAGVNCVKFQSWSPSSINAQCVYDQNPIAGRIYEKFSFREEQLLELSTFCEEVNISFASTPYSKREVEFLALRCNVPFIKVASMDVNNYPFLDYIARTGLPIVLSTGMADLEEIRRAIRILENAGNKSICILHCISIYPADVSVTNLRNILSFRREFPQYPIGFSDHSIGIEVAPAAVALGASLIEKHFTLDKSKIGMDNQIACEPEEMAELVRQCHSVHSALGNFERIVSTEEFAQRLKMRRSAVAIRDLEPGHVLSGSDIEFKRPGTGFPPDALDQLVGKALRKSIKVDQMFTDDHFS